MNAGGGLGAAVVPRVVCRAHPKMFIQTKKYYFWFMIFCTDIGIKRLECCRNENCCPATEKGREGVIPFNIYSNIILKYIKYFIMYEFWGLDGVLPKTIKIHSCNTETFNTAQVTNSAL